MSLIPKVVGLLPRPWIKAASRTQWKHPLLKRGFDFCANKFRNQDGTIQQGIGKGLRFNAGQTNAGFLLGTSEPGVQSALESLINPGMTVYDVGANVGFLTVIAARLVGPSGKVICFEPLPSNAHQIEHNMRLNDFTHVAIRPVALGAMNGESKFLVSTEPTWGKLASVGATVSNKVGEMEVMVRRLDDLLTEDPLPRPDLMKIDVEGAEADVLAGAAETIRQARPLLMIELHGTNVAVFTALGSLAYHAAVLGTSLPIVDSPWDAYIIAAPMERPDLVQTVDNLCSSIALPR